MKTQKTNSYKSALCVVVLVPVIALFGCAKSVDHYVEDEQDRTTVGDACVVKFGLIAVMDNRPELSTDCKNVMQAARRVAAGKAEKTTKALDAYFGR